MELTTGVKLGRKWKRGLAVRQRDPSAGILRARSRMLWCVRPKGGLAWREPELRTSQLRDSAGLSSSHESPDFALIYF